MNRVLFLSFLVVAFGFNSGSPISKPQVALASSNEEMIAECPKIDMTYPDPFDEKAPLKFEVRIEGADPNKQLKYSWFVSKGRVKSGQGTASIVVEVDGVERQGLTATVVICGLPYECENEISRTTATAKLNIPPNAAPNNSFNRSGNGSNVIRKIEGLIQYFPPG